MLKRIPTEPDYYTARIDIDGVKIIAGLPIFAYESFRREKNTDILIALYLGPTVLRSKLVKPKSKADESS